MASHLLSAAIAVRIKFINFRVCFPFSPILILSTVFLCPLIYEYHVSIKQHKLLEIKWQRLQCFLTVSPEVEVAFPQT